MQIPWDIVHKLRHCRNCRVMCIMGKFPLRIGSFPVRKKVPERRERNILFTTYSLVVYSTTLFVLVELAPVVVKRGKSVYKLKPTK